MSFRLGLLVVAGAFLALVGEAWAAQRRVGILELDPSKTLIEFRLPGALHTTHGKFELERGVIKAEPVTGAAGGLIVVDAATGDSGVSARDNRMKDSILQVEKFPKITFTPEHVTGEIEDDGRFQAKLTGTIGLHRGAHEIVADVQGQLIGDRLVATAHFFVPYVEWGLEDPSMLFLKVAKEVEIKVTTAGNVVWSPKGPDATASGQ